MLDAETAAPPPWGAYPPSLSARALIQASRNSLLGRGLLRQRLAELFSRLHSGPVDAWLWGQKVRLFPDHNVCERKALLRPDRMDRHELAFLRAQMHRPRPVFVDVGANAGLYSLYAALDLTTGRVLGDQINRLANAGAKVLISTIPDLGLTPFAIAERAAHASRRRTPSSPTSSA